MSYTAIKTTWNSFAKQDTKRAFPLQSVVKNVNKAVLEAYKLSNLHVLRCIRDNLQFTINQEFYYSCLTAVSKQMLRKDQGIKDVDLQVTLSLYNSRKPNSYVPPTKDYTGGLFNNAAQQMITMTKNYFVYTFYKRLFRYLKRKYILWSYQDIHLFIKNVYDLEYSGYDAEVWKIKDLLGYEKPFTQNVIPVLCRILKFSERTHQRLFSLLPNRKTFTVCYVKFDSTCLHDILISAKIMKRDKNFIANKRTYWTKFFNIQDFETRNRSFAYEILTDGKAVSVILKKSSSGSSVCREPDTDYDLVWGLDPGRSQVFTAMSNHGELQTLSTKEFYTESNYVKKNKKYAYWYKKDTRVSTTFKSLPSLKTTNISKYLEYLDIFFAEVDYLLDFHFRKPFRDVKFTTYIQSQKKLQKMCKQLVQDKENVLVGFGDWSNQDSPVLKLEKGPVKKFKECLKRYATVIDIDEFKTSKTCNCCHEELAKTNVYTVLRCSNTFCRRNLLNRDRNAAQNILCLTQHVLNNIPRPTCFTRSSLPS